MQFSYQYLGVLGSFRDGRAGWGAEPEAWSLEPGASPRSRVTTRWTNKLLGALDRRVMSVSSLASFNSSGYAPFAFCLNNTHGAEIVSKTLGD